MWQYLLNKFTLMITEFDIDTWIWMSYQKINTWNYQPEKQIFNLFLSKNLARQKFEGSKGVAVIIIICKLALMRVVIKPGLANVIFKIQLGNNTIYWKNLFHFKVFFRLSLHFLIFSPGKEGCTALNCNKIMNLSMINCYD